MSTEKVRLYVVPMNHVLGLFSHALAKPMCISLPKFDVPDDAIVKSVNFDCSYRAFMFGVEHDSFDEVREGENVPMFCAYETVKVDILPDLSEYNRLVDDLVRYEKELEVIDTILDNFGISSIVDTDEMDEDDDSKKKYLSTKDRVKLLLDLVK